MTWCQLGNKPFIAQDSDDHDWCCVIPRLCQIIQPEGTIDNKSEGPVDNKSELVAQSHYRDLYRPSSLILNDVTLYTLGLT